MEASGTNVMTVKSEEDDEERFVRATKMSAELYPAIMRIMVERKMSSKQFESKIQKNEQGFIRFLDDYEKKQLQTISTSGYSELDVSILYKIIRCFNLVDKPSAKRWGSPPLSSSQVTTGDDVERMRIRRNSMMHYPAAHMTVDEWNEFYDELLAIAKRSDHHYGVNKFERKAKSMRTEWLDSSKRDQYIKALNDKITLKAQIQEGHRHLRFFYGEDIENLLAETNEANKDKRVLLMSFVHGVHNKKTAIQNFKEIIGLLEDEHSEIALKEVSNGSIYLQVCVRRKIFFSKTRFHECFRSFLRTTLPDDSLSVVISIDNSGVVDNIFMDTRNWRTVREQTLPNLVAIERSLSRAANNLRDFRIVRNTGAGVAVLLGLFLLPFTFGGSAPVVVGGIAAGVGGVALLSIIVESYLTNDVMEAAQSQIERDRIQTLVLEESVNYYIHQRIDKIQKLLATRLRENFPDAIYITENKPFSDFIFSFINTEVGSIFRARDEVRRFLNDLRTELNNVKRLEEEALESLT